MASMCGLGEMPLSYKHSTSLTYKTPVVKGIIHPTCYIVGKNVASQEYADNMKLAESYLIDKHGMDYNFTDNKNYYNGFDFDIQPASNEMVVLMDVDWLLNHRGNRLREGDEEYYVKKMKRGDKIEVPHVYVDNEGASVDEGNHRIAASKALGYTSVPVQVRFNYHSAWSEMF